MWRILSYIPWLGITESTRMTDWLISAAEVSNLISFLSVILSFTAMFFFLVRLIGQDMVEGGALTRITHAPPRTNFTKILLPFRIKLIGVKEPYRIELSVTALTSGTFRIFWGVNINSFHQVLRAPRDWFYSAYTHGNLFGQGKCIQFGEMEAIEKIEDGRIFLEKPTNTSLLLGPAPRNVYPVVIVLLCEDSALLTALHIRDEECTVPSQILAEYYKHGTAATLLQPIFVASADIGENSDTESQEDSDTEELSDAGFKRRCRVARCIICQQEKITRVILPCRHATSCSQCFQRLQSCPMCRGYIQSYFLIGPEQEQQQQQQHTVQQAQNRGWWDHLENWRLWFNGPLVLQDQD